MGPTGPKGVPNGPRHNLGHRVVQLKSKREGGGGN